MSEENVELTHRAAETFNRRDLDGFLALLAEDVRADPQLARMEGGYRGHAGIRRWWDALLDEIPDFTAEIIEVRDYGDDLVLAVSTIAATARRALRPLSKPRGCPYASGRGNACGGGTTSTRKKHLRQPGCGSSRRPSGRGLRVTRGREILRGRCRKGTSSWCAAFRRAHDAVPARQAPWNLKGPLDEGPLGEAETDSG